MYICLCNGITDRDISAAARDGVTTLEQLQVRTGCATNCGSCADHAMEIVHAVRRSQESAASLERNRFNLNIV